MIKTATATLKTFGLDQERIEVVLKEVCASRDGVGQVFAVGPEDHLQILASGEDAVQRLEEIKEELANRLGDYIFGEENDTMEIVVGQVLAQKGLTLAVAESLTGGLVSDRITDVSGSSGYFIAGVIVYSNESKTDLLGVSAAVIREKGAVSPEVARLMAEGVRERHGTTFGLATTGIAGPTGGTPLKPVGTVYMAVASPTDCQVEGKLFSGDRRSIKVAATTYALDMLRRKVKGF